MKIYLIKNGQNSGPYSEAEVMNRVHSGSYTLNDLAWFEGCTGPIPIAQVFAGPMSVTIGSVPAPDSTASHELYSAEELTLIADLQKKLILVIMGSFVFAFIPIPALFKFIEILIEVVGSAYVIHVGWKLTLLMRGNPWAWLVISFVPLLNLFNWCRTIRAATKLLRANGIPCGFMGADQAALQRLRNIA